MKRLAWCLVALMVPAFASAQDVDGDSFINVTLTQPSYGGCAAGDGIDDGVCDDLASEVIVGPSFLFTVVSKLGGYPDGLGAAQWGMDYSFGHTGWTLCTGGAEIPEGGWPDSGFGNAATWAGGCYTPGGENAIVGFYALGDGSVGSVQVTGDPRTAGQALYTDCVPNLFETPAGNLGGGDLANGLLPVCSGGTPTVEKSWSSLKSLF